MRERPAHEKCKKAEEKGEKELDNASYKLYYVNLQIWIDSSRYATRWRHRLTHTPLSLPLAHNPQRLGHNRLETTTAKNARLGRRPLQSHSQFGSWARNFPVARGVLKDLTPKGASYTGARPA